MYNILFLEHTIPKLGAESERRSNQDLCIITEPAYIRQPPVTGTRSTTMALPPGTAPLKQEYAQFNLITYVFNKKIHRFLIRAEPRPLPDDDAVEGNIHHAGVNDKDSRRRPNKEQRKEKRGANKGRRWVKQRDDLDLCWRLANGSLCEFGEE